MRNTQAEHFWSATLPGADLKAAGSHFADGANGRRPSIDGGLSMRIVSFIHSVVMGMGFPR
jgi:hypothetical protein